MYNNAKIVLLAILLIGLVTVSSNIRMKNSARKVVLDAKSSITTEMGQISLTYLMTTDEVIPHFPHRP